MRLLGYLLLVAVYIYVIAPAAVIIFGSFNSATSFPSGFESFTLSWYAAILQHDEFLEAMRTSAVVAVIAATIGSIAAFPAAYALVRLPVPGKAALETFFLAPLVVPQIVIGLAMLQLLSALSIQLGLGGLVVVHSVYVLPFVLRSVMTTLARFDFGLEEAARTLGADRLRTVWHVTLPLVRTGIVAGFTFAFILSFVNLPLTLFLATPSTTTLPIQMYAYMESRIDPLVAGVGSLIVLVVFLTSFTIERVLKFRLLT